MTATSQHQNKAGTLRLGTRSSRLALAQAEIVRQKLRPFGVECRIVELDTLGDRELNKPISEFDSAAPFVDDVESALLRNEIDIAVHSLKDMPLAPTPGLTVAAVLERGDPRESIVSKNGERFDELPAGAIIGTSCSRRSAQIQYLRPDLQTASIRGPVDDRIRQVREGKFDAAILAIAGLYRSGLAGEAAEVFALSRFLPAPAQAALAIQVRGDDTETRDLTKQVDHAATRDAVSAELTVLTHFESRKDITIAAVAREAVGLQLRVRVLQIEGRPVLESVIAGRCAESVAQHAIHRIEEAISQRKAAV
ncbi:MAG: hydroxymethylbilane synthase [Phycisphaerales bacterium]|nr:hydroxymethylbilane synthase [Phycisphaerales bacterium]MCB9862413.1 hydroxymethylbilane synthase [Phycisphaerales bacterium]